MEERIKRVENNTAEMFRRLGTLEVTQARIEEKQAAHSADMQRLANEVHALTATLQPISDRMQNWKGGFAVAVIFAGLLLSIIGGAVSAGVRWLINGAGS